MNGLVTFFANATDQINTGVNAACSSACNKGNVNGLFAGVANALIFLVGAIAVIMIIIGGLRYVISNGDSKQTESAKNTILYAVIGLVVAIASFAIVGFVTKNIK